MSDTPQNPTDQDEAELLWEKRKILKYDIATLDVIARGEFVAGYRAGQASKEPVELLKTWTEQWKLGEAERTAALREENARLKDKLKIQDEQVFSVMTKLTALEKKSLALVEIGKRISDAISWYDSTQSNHESARPAILENCRLLSKALAAYRKDGGKL